MIAKSWVKKNCDEALAQTLACELSISPLLARLMVMRKVRNSEEARQFLHPSLKNLIDPLAFAGMSAAIERLACAVTTKEHIGVFGDYDVDGVCSAAILSQFLKSLEANVHTTLPNRLKEGYGLSTSGVDRLKDAGASLLVTVDCGALAHDQIDYANTQGLEVIVVDHHNMGLELPKAVAVVNPKRPDCLAKAEYLCAAGVTFFLILALRRQLREQNFFLAKPEPDLRDLLDLVACATVSDVVPLIGYNRSLVRAGLKSIKEQHRVGLSALIKTCGLEPHKISSTNLGFHLGPRINAAGRLEDASVALRLLGIKDLKEAEELAHKLHHTNEARKDIEAQTVLEAETLIKAWAELPSAIVLHNESWHPGVVGIVASRVAELFHRPSIIIGKDGKGSGRSIKGLDLHAMVQKASGTLLGFGGHAHAIGLTLGPLGVLPFSRELNAVVKEHALPDLFEKQLYFDAEISLAQVSLSLAEELSSLEPFGAANPYPVLRIDHCFMRNIKRLNGGHLKGELEDSSGSASFIAFRTSVSDELANSPLDILAVVEKNEWQGRISAQLRLIDFRSTKK